METGIEKMLIEKMLIEEAGKNGYASYRIPGIVVTSLGTLLVYYETRRESGDDWSTQGIGMKRSTDGGKTFTPRTMLVSDPAGAINNPVMIASRDGRVHFFWQKRYREAFYQVSTDDGCTFSSPICLTPVLEQFRKKYNWTLFALGPGHGIELRNGRFVIPVWLANGEGNHHFPSQVGTLVSDDGGKTWHAGDIIQGSENPADPFACPNETQAVELSDGSVLFNMRHSGSHHVRYISVSPNGKDHFSPPCPDTTLPDSMYFGSIIRTNQPGQILFINCANRKNANKGSWAPRKWLTLRVSSDNAKTWKASKVLEEYGGYADLALSADGERYYCLYENGCLPNNIDPQRLTLAVLPKDWIFESPQ